LETGPRASGLDDAASIHFATLADQVGLSGGIDWIQRQHLNYFLQETEASVLIEPSHPAQRK